MRRLLITWFALCGLLFAAHSFADDMTLLGVGTTKTVASGGCSFPTLSATLMARYSAQSQVYKDAGITPAGNGDSVGQWNDLANAGIYLQGGGGSGVAPVYNTTSFNGHPGITFSSAASSVMVSYNGSTVTPYSLNSTTFSMFSLLSLSDASGGFGPALLGSGSPDTYNNNSAFTSEMSGSVAQANFYGNNAIIANGGAAFTYAFNTPQSLGIIFTGSVANAYVAMSVQGSGTSWTTALGNTAAGFLIGTYASSRPPGSSFDGVIGEIDAFSGALSGGDMTSLQTYYTCAWGTH